jgi:hypothetical protein
MQIKSVDREPGPRKATVERHPPPPVVVARRLDSNRPTRVWSLLLPPRFFPTGERK